MINAENSKFKDKQGRWFTQSLFYEAVYGKHDGRTTPMYTFKDTDFNGLPSIKRIYLELEDPTEYRIATEYLGGWEHWKLLCSSKWFTMHLTNWREELEIKMRSKYLQKMLELTNNSSASVAKDASKFFVNKEYETKRGRPSKEEKERQQKLDSHISYQIESDFKLLNLNER